jgi:hypothetical membrane protein
VSAPAPVTAVPRWALLSSAAAPVLLIGGWTVAAARQPASFDSVRDTISALAAHGATDRWLMTGCLAGLGLCHLITASGLRPARLPGRALLGLGGVATLLVAAFPLPSGGGSSTPHTLAAGVAFVALAAWPAIAGRSAGSGLLTRRAGLLAAAGLLGLVGWFGLALGGEQQGLAERAAAGAQALWPLAVVVSARRARRSPS